MKPLTPLAIGKIVPLLFFYNDGFAIQLNQNFNQNFLKIGENQNLQIITKTVTNYS